MTKKIDETYDIIEGLEEMEKVGLLRDPNRVMVGLLLDMSLSLVRITDALEKLSEVKE